MLGIISQKSKLIGLWFTSFTAITILIASVSISAQAGPQCQQLFEVKYPKITVSQLDDSASLHMRPQSFYKIRKIFKENGIELKTSSIKRAIEAAVQKISSAKQEPSLENSEKMALISRKMLEILKPEMTDKQHMMTNYLLAEAVLKLETIDHSNFTGQIPHVFADTAVLKISQFNKFVESYIDGTDLYKNLTSTAGLLQWPDIRSLYASNQWIIGLKNHDMYHLHYSYGHPYYLAVNLMASRTINDRRYYMISSLWEAVDGFTSGYESKIARHFGILKMSPEQGMLFLATATNSEMTALEESIGKASSSNSYYELSYENGWRPTATTKGSDTSTYFKEIETYLNIALKNAKDDTKLKYRNYHRKGAGASVEVDENHVAGYN